MKGRKDQSGFTFYVSKQMAAKRPEKHLISCLLHLPYSRQDSPATRLLISRVNGEALT